MPDKTDPKKTYALLEKKYRLPDYSFLQQNFDIDMIEPERLTLREVRRKMHEKIEWIAKVLESWLQPDTNLQNLYEVGIFNEEDKKKVYLIYKELMSLHSSSLILEIQGNDELNAEFIRDFGDRWKILRTQVLKYFENVKIGWNKESQIEEKLGYFG
ncbi:MAG: hypothetical protein QS98_C0001G0032 [archaeon GW2011_AR3]|nr:MAG: hypothetical protein QS98_C0001G0032 [archaeon GW2011_AR3]MBS3109310.1 hypothetical protein [Candidatus Woesearchaeota archaeon]